MVKVDTRESVSCTPGHIANERRMQCGWVDGWVMVGARAKRAFV